MKPSESQKSNGQITYRKKYVFLKFKFKYNSLQSLDFLYIFPIFLFNKIIYPKSEHVFDEILNKVLQINFKIIN